ncbi:MAG: Cytochrome c oxidase polypeptide I+III [Phycisphaerae bacterium]|nr:Cytochrome c oxidase polypeptide I+III [Phycisphaerae bacterium]
MNPYEITPTGSSPPAAPPQLSSGTFGMLLFLVSLSILFIASLIGYLVVRSRAELWLPPGQPSVPLGFWVSSAILLISSGTIHWALRSVRRGRSAGLLAGLLITLLLSVVFLGLQTMSWWYLWAIGEVTRHASLYAFTLYMLTGLHGAHVLGGLVLLAVVTIRAFKDRYDARLHGGVKYAAMYWHFLDGVWLVMFIAFLTA